MDEREAFRLVMKAKSRGWSDDETITSLRMMGAPDEMIMSCLRKVGTSSKWEYQKRVFREPGVATRIAAVLLAVFVLYGAYGMALELFDFLTKDAPGIIDEWAHDPQPADTPLYPLRENASLYEDGTFTLSMKNNMRVSATIIDGGIAVMDPGRESCGWHMAQPRYVDVGETFNILCGGCPAGEAGEPFEMTVSIRYSVGEGLFERERSSTHTVRGEILEGGPADE